MQKREHFVFVILGIAVAAIGVSVFFALVNVRLQVQERVGSSLRTLLSTSDQALRIWAEGTEEDVTVLAKSDQLEAEVKRQLTLPRDPRLLRTGPALESIRHLLRPALETYKFPGFAILAPDGLQVAAKFDAAVGAREIAEDEPELLRSAMAGNVSLGLPYRSPQFVDEMTQHEYPIMTVAAPMREASGNVIAALAFRLDPRKDLSRTLKLGRLDKTGETYAFDRNGRILTESRYEDQLHRDGLVPQDEASILNLEIRDPGGDVTKGYHPNIPRAQQPFTRMAAAAMQGTAGIDLNGYRDYRGVPVVGTWLWDDQLGMGLASEMDVSDAYAPYYRFRSAVLLLSFLSFSLICVLIPLVRRSDRLLGVNQAYDQAMRARDDMMAIVAHDLRNPLNAIILRSHLLLQLVGECGGEEVTDIRHNLEMLQRTATHMNQLIGDLTDAAKLHAGRLHLERRECTIQQAVEPPLERMRLLAREKEIEFVCQVTPVPARVSIDPPRIIQVIDNLVGNALKFTPPGGKITVAVAAVEGKVHISVADSGPGITEEAQKRVFEPYWQVQRTRSGMGLGLFIAKNIIDGHDGRIWVESAVGQGTTFHFTLPTIS